MLIVLVIAALATVFLVGAALTLVATILRFLARLALATLVGLAIGLASAGLATLADVDRNAIGFGFGLCGFLIALWWTARKREPPTSDVGDMPERSCLPPGGADADVARPVASTLISPLMAARANEVTLQLQAAAAADPFNPVLNDWLAVVRRIPELISESETAYACSAPEEQWVIRAGLIEDLDALIAEADRRLAPTRRHRLAVLRRWVAIRVAEAKVG